MNIFEVTLSSGEQREFSYDSESSPWFWIWYSPLGSNRISKFSLTKTKKEAIKEAFDSISSRYTNIYQDNDNIKNMGQGERNWHRRNFINAHTVEVVLTSPITKH